MKIYLETKVLVDAAAAEGTSPSRCSELISELAQLPDADIWISALALPALETILSQKKGCPLVRDFVERSCSVIPFRRSTFARARESGTADLESAIHVASAQQLGIDCIVAMNPGDYRSSPIPALAPDEFRESWSAGMAPRVRSVPFLDLSAQHHLIYNQIDDCFTDIIKSNSFISGTYVAGFEKRFAELQGVRYCIGVSSGTDALHTALLALGVGPGDEVIVPANTFIATAEAVSHTGAVPVFVDCNEYYTVDTECLQDIVTQRADKIKAIIPVHLYGQPANMAEIMAIARDSGLRVIEDCCQAHLARVGRQPVGTFGEFGAFSFYPGKNLGAYGEAGALITNDENLYRQALMLRQHGEIERYHHLIVGHNYRMEALQGAVLGTKLPFLPEWTDKRRRNAYRYNELLEGIAGVATPRERENLFCVYHLYVIQTDQRDGLAQFLRNRGIATGLHYPVPLHLQRAYHHLGYRQGDFPVAEKSSRRILSLPLYPELTDQQIQFVCKNIETFIATQE